MNLQVGKMYVFRETRYGSTNPEGEGDENWYTLPKGEVVVLLEQLSLPKGMKLLCSNGLVLYTWVSSNILEEAT